MIIRILRKNWPKLYPQAKLEKEYWSAEVESALLLRPVNFQAYEQGCATILTRPTRVWSMTI